MKARYLKIGAVCVAVIAAAFLWYLLGRTGGAPVTSGGVLMIMTQRGGLCSSDSQENAVCESSYRVFNNGTFEGHRRFSANEMNELRGIITRTDFTSYERNANPACPSFADGIDLALSFPAKHPGRQFTPCTLDIPEDDTGIRAIVTLLDKHARQ